jgi:hypothetical protein
MKRKTLWTTEGWVTQYVRKKLGWFKDTILKMVNEGGWSALMHAHFDLTVCQQAEQKQSHQQPLHSGRVSAV